MNLQIDDLPLKASHPKLYRHIMPHYDGRRLMTAAGRISISIEGKIYRVSLTMPTYKTQCVVLCESLTTWMDDVERYLGMPTTVYLPMWEKNKKALPTIDDLI
jgi:hypothetical protein